MNATGVVYTPGVCRGQCPHAHFWAYDILTSVGIQLCSFTGWAVEGLRWRNEQMKIPRFLYAVTNN